VKTRIFTSILLLALSFISLIFLCQPVANAQENAVFSVSPGSFTVTQVPPLGSQYVIPQTIVVRNNDNIEREVFITTEKPPENETTLGYEPIPNENWVIPSTASVMIEADNFAIIQLSLDIPRDENLTNQKWEVWIPVEREPNPGEIGVLRPTVRVDIETTTTLPPVGKSTTSLTISEENFTLRGGESKYLTAELISGGSLIEGENITWGATAGTIAPSSGQTNSLGQVTVVYTAPSNKTVVVVIASYDGSDNYEPSSISSYGTITAAPSKGISAWVIIGIAVVVGCVIIGAAIAIKR
jgi:hypothetical protein